MTEAELETVELRLRADLAAVAADADPTAPELPAVVAEARRKDRRGRLRYVAAIAALAIPAVVVAGVRLRWDADDTRASTFPASVEDSGIPLLDGAYREEGPLDDGLVVPRGTALLGDLFYFPDAGTDDRGNVVDGWIAHFLVFGDLHEVAEDLDRQAVALGLAIGSNDNCETERSSTVCSAWWGGDFNVSMVLVRGRAGGEPVSRLELTVTRRPGFDPAVQLPPFDLPNVPLPDGWTDPPRPGEGMADRVADEAFRSLRVPDGARAVMASWRSFDRGYQAVLAVDGDLDAVLDDFALQLEDLHIGDVARGDHRVDDADVVFLQVHEAGGRDYRIEAVTAHGRSWIAVTTSSG